MKMNFVVSSVIARVLKEYKPNYRCLGFFGSFRDHRQFQHVRWLSVQNRKEITKSDRDSSSEVSTTLHAVKETTKTASYTGVILVGVGVTGMLFYAIFKELFSSKSPNCVYAKALDKCIADNRVVDSLGEPIKGFGEESRRGRRRHVSHLLYEKDGVNYLRMKFYIKGGRRKGTVNLEMKENAKGDYEYRYLFVQLEDYPYTSIILEDNRVDMTKPIDVIPLPELTLTS